MTQAKLLLIFYLVGDEVIIPTLAKTKAGYHLTVEPVAVHDLSDAKLAAVLADYLKRVQFRHHPRQNSPNPWCRDTPA